VAADYCTGLGGTCVPLKTAGTACTSNDQCGTGFCTDGVCCGVSLCPSCQTCGALGACGFTPPGMQDETGTCKDQGAATCGNDGLCDGVGGCQDYAISTSCGSVCASDNSSLQQSFCDGLGDCSPALAIPCPTDMCDGTLAGCL
jgi:hypothetical protein